MTWISQGSNVKTVRLYGNGDLIDAQVVYNGSKITEYTLTVGSYFLTVEVTTDTDQTASVFPHSITITKDLIAICTVTRLEHS